MKSVTVPSGTKERTLKKVWVLVGDKEAEQAATYCQKTIEK